MEQRVIDIVEDCTHGSDQGRLTFPEVVAKLMAAGIEQYHADLRRAEKTYYMPGGPSHVAACAPVAGVGDPFSAAGVATAIREIQAQRIGYVRFCERIAAAGCVGYIVSLAGRRAVYFGRTGECLVEPFPGAK
jgi:uncharacterized protein YbcV (DUF1398 family)